MKVLLSVVSPETRDLSNPKPTVVTTIASQTKAKTSLPKCVYVNSKQKNDIKTSHIEVCKCGGECKKIS